MDHTPELFIISVKQVGYPFYLDVSDRYWASSPEDAVQHYCDDHPGFVHEMDVIVRSRGGACLYTFTIKPRTGPTIIATGA